MDFARYTVAWIAPLPLELTAARGMFDGETETEEVDGCRYEGGQISGHWVIMAVQSVLGTIEACDLASRMRANFKNIRFFLVVGIGGGVPHYGPPGSRSKIVLGDVVVSFPVMNHGGIVQYAFGAWTGEGLLERSGHTNGPPKYLLRAVRTLSSNHMSRESRIPLNLRNMRERILEDKRHEFEDPGGEKDRLFRSDFSHEFWNKSCEDICDLSQSESRESRGAEAARLPDRPRIHYGNIGSGDQLQISALMRDRLCEEDAVICFEMEGAGVIHNNDCLVIRGICDYADSHKNKLWQPYAAATAAAYAKELLSTIPKSDIAGKSCVPMLSGLTLT